MTTTAKAKQPGRSNNPVWWAEALEGRVLLSTATFAPPQIYHLNETPKDMAIADFSGDGFPDIATVISGGTQIGILLNNGDGTFTRAPYLPDGAPRSIAAADFNHDGHIDLAVVGGNTSSGQTSGQLEIFSGNGNGTFVRPPKRYNLAAGGPQVVAADLNGDGWADLVVTTSQRVAVFINEQDGIFAKPVYYTIGDNTPTGLVVRDFNHDGVPDIAVSNGRPGYVSVLLGNKNAPGTFGPPNFFPTGGNPVALTSGDFNGDGNIDLAVVNSQFKGNTVATLIGNGDGTFRAPSLFRTANFSDAIAAADFSGDGKSDLVVGSFVGALRLYPGNGDGTFAPAITFAGGVYAQVVEAADLNGDGKPDLAVTPRGGVRVLLNTTGTVTPPPSGNGLDRTLGSGNPRSFMFYTPEGTQATVSLSGPGAARLHFSSSTTITLATNGQRVDALTLSDIIGAGTTLSTSLMINAGYGSRTITFNSITSDGALGSINAPRASVASITLPGGAKQINLLSANAGSITLGGSPQPSLTLQSISGETIRSAAPVRQIQVRLDAAIALLAPSVNSISVGGHLLNSTLTLTAPFSSKSADLTSLSVNRGVFSSTIDSAGNIKTVAVKNLTDSAVYAGVAPLAPGQTLPTVPADFVAEASIDAVTLQVDTRQSSFANSVIVASVEGTLALGTVQTNNNGVVFGLAAHSIIRSATGTALSDNRQFRLSRITTTQQALAAFAAQKIDPQNFSVQII
jgi:hypothetical protein